MIYKANPPSGGAVTHIGLGSFLNRETMTPEVLGLLKLIGTLVE